MRDQACRRGVVGIAVLPILAALGVGGSAHAKEGKWTLELEPMYMEIHGHDPHVLTIHEMDLDSTPTLDDKTAVSLDTDDGLAYRGEFRYTGGEWGWGVDFFLLLTSQGAANRTAAAGGPSGPIEEVVFEVADRGFTSTGPSEVLFYGVLEDTDLEVWTVDVYGTRSLAERPESGIRMLFGLRIGDFDNDYRAVVGVQDVAGSRLDASSNYSLMMGPLVGLAGSVRRGRNSIEGTVAQSMLLGSAELTGMSREFTGPFSSMPSFVARETFRREQDVAIPITEFRIKWAFRVSEHVSLGAGVNTSVWWDVSVPAGVVPIENGDEALHENTIVFFGLSGAVKLTF